MELKKLILGCSGTVDLFWTTLLIQTVLCLLWKISWWYSALSWIYITNPLTDKEATKHENESSKIGLVFFTKAAPFFEYMYGFNVWQPALLFGSSKLFSSSELSLHTHTHTLTYPERLNRFLHSVICHNGIVPISRGQSSTKRVSSRSQLVTWAGRVPDTLGLDLKHRVYEGYTGVKLAECISLFKLKNSHMILFALEK